MNTPLNTNSADSGSTAPLRITGGAKPAVPVFSCIVYVRKGEEGTIIGRVANLAGVDSGEISASGSSERDVLMKATREFKSRVAKLHGENEAIPWITPVQAPSENEQVRTIAVHL